MPRKIKVRPAGKYVDEKCPSCAGTGEVPDTKPVYEPRPTMPDEPRGPKYRVKGLIKIKRKCIRCGGRGTIRVWRDREVS